MIYLFVVIVCTSISFNSIKFHFIDYDNQQTSLVIGDISYGDVTSFLVKQKGKRYIVYTREDVELNLGDKVLIEGEINTPINETIPNTFNYRNYLLSQNIDKTIYANSVEVVGNRFVLGNIRSTVKEYINNAHPYSSRYIKTFILADKTGFNQQHINDVNYLGVSHLFAVSGLHVGLLVVGLKKLTEIYIKKIKSEYIIISLLILYMVITSFSPSIVRAGFMYILIYVNKKFKLEFSVLDILSIIFIFYMILNPFSIYDLGFSLSFLITLTILLSQYMFKGKSNIQQLFLISLIAMLVSLPITTSISKEINLLTLFVNVILVMLMTTIILPVGYITFILYPLDRFYNYATVIFDLIIAKLANIDMFLVGLSFVHPIQVCIYYVILFLVVSTEHYRKEFSITFIVFILISLNIQVLNPSKMVSMIDVYGDSFLVRDSFDRCNILIDTGSPDDYDSVIHYIKGKQIKRIDYLIITHNHADHNGELEDILKELKVIDIISSERNVPEEIKCGSLFLDFFQFYNQYKEENNQSVVFTLSIDHHMYLFTGDMEEIKENEFIDLYSIDVDILKSGHHGSITSSSEDFLKAISAESVIISCYRYNTFDHPHDVIINRYNELNLNIYRTDELGTLETYYFMNKVYKKYHKP